MEHNHQKLYLTMALILAVLMLSFILWPKAARAHDPQTHQVDDLANAKSDAFGTCCNGDDYVYIRVSDWETTDTGYRIFVNGRWLEAKRNVKVSNMQNPDGEAKVWINGPKDDPYVRCFMPGALG